jgi:hypothetical protein
VHYQLARICQAGVSENVAKGRSSFYLSLNIQKRDFSEKKAVLQGIIDEVGSMGHPATDLIKRNAESYRECAW